VIFYSIKGELPFLVSFSLNGIQSGAPFWNFLVLCGRCRWKAIQQIRMNDENNNIAMHPKNKNLQIALHHCSFIKFHSSAVVAISPDCSCSGEHFVVARENGDLEKRSAYMGWAVEHYIPNAIQSGKPITSVVEIAPNVVATSSLDGLFTIWNLESRTRVHQSIPGGGAIWCMEADPTINLMKDGKVVIAIGCEDGRVRLIHITSHPMDDENDHQRSIQVVEYVERIEPGPSRVLSLTWSLEPNGKFLLTTDDAGNIRKLETQKCLQVMKITQKGSPVVIWSIIALQLTPDYHYYVTGDARGTITIWDAKTCSAIQEFNVDNCKGDITCVTAVVHFSRKYRDNQHLVLPDVDILFGAADGGIGAIRGNPIDSQYHWIPVRGRSLHARDVRTIKAIGKNKIVSGGADYRISMIDTDDFFSDAFATRLYPSKRPHRPSCAYYYRHQDLLVAEHDHHIDFWKDTATLSDKIIFRYNLRKGDGNIGASTLSKDGSWWAVATTRTIRIYQMQIAIQQRANLAVKVEPFQTIPYSGARQLLWIQESDTRCYLLALSKEADAVHVYTLYITGNGSWKMEKTPRRIFWTNLVSTSKTGTCSSITCMTTEKEEEEETCLLAVGDRHGNVFVLDVRGDVDRPVASLQGCLSESVVAMCLQQNVLLVCGCQGQVKLWRVIQEDVGDRQERKMERLPAWSEAVGEWFKEQVILSLDWLPIYGVDMDVDSSCLLIYGHHYIILLHWEQLEEMITNQKDRRNEESTGETMPGERGHEEKRNYAKKIQKLPSKKLQWMHPLENVAYACFMSENKQRADEEEENQHHSISILCVEHPWEDMLSQMPPAVWKKKFGV